MQISPEAIADVVVKTFGAAAVFVTAWYAGRSKLKKAINNGNDPLERRKDSITIVDHIECKKDREATEDKLFDKIEAARKEVKTDIGEVHKRQDKIREEICNKIDLFAQAKQGS